MINHKSKCNQTSFLKCFPSMQLHESFCVKSFQKQNWKIFYTISLSYKDWGHIEVSERPVLIRKKDWGINTVFKLHPVSWKCNNIDCSTTPVVSYQLNDKCAMPQERHLIERNRHLGKNKKDNCTSYLHQKLSQLILHFLLPGIHYGGSWYNYYKMESKDCSCCMRRTQGEGCLQKRQ
jgi:hypothetical protein